MTGKYTTNYFNDKSDVGCVCMLNDRFSSSDEIFADYYNFSQFKLKGKFHCDGAAADGVERLQETMAYLLVSGGDGNCAPRQRSSAPSPMRSARQRQRETSTAGTFLASLTFLFLVSHSAFYNVVFESHFFQ